MANSTVKAVTIVLLAVVVVLAGFYLYHKSAVTQPYQAQYSPVYSPSTMTQTSTNPSTNNSNAQLDKDLNSINTKLNAVNQEQGGIDAGLNQTAPNLGQ